MRPRTNLERAMGGRPQRSANSCWRRPTCPCLRCRKPSCFGGSPLAQHPLKLDSKSFGGARQAQPAKVASCSAELASRTCSMGHRMPAAPRSTPALSPDPSRIPRDRPSHPISRSRHVPFERRQARSSSPWICPLLERPHLPSIYCPILQFADRLTPYASRPSSISLRSRTIRPASSLLSKKA